MLKKKFLFLGLATILTSQIDATIYKVNNKKATSCIALCIYDNGEELIKTINSHDQLILSPIASDHEDKSAQVSSIYIFKSLDDIKIYDNSILSNYLFVLFFKNSEEKFQEITIYSDSSLVVQKLANLKD
ncbi:hypothetical protein KJ644_00490 [Candidatus Dependentiae bacterium]|nr:hypothetical protein [Candidatus Dependentiae bacterium]MBU4386932.1 hypothetical protein [Candidatus Dependentiae bacterium]MCG2756409.1 hypothetical protein [Candidatus Dependentiae bacterium]